MPVGNNPNDFGVGTYTGPDLGYQGRSSAWNTLSGTEAAQFNQQLFDARQAELAYVRNSVEAQKNRDWETQMSNTAYQRAVADMKAAGINPASLGGDGNAAPASTPSGYASSVNAATSSAIGGGNGGLLGMIGRVASAALTMALFKKFSHSATVAPSAAAAAGKVGAEVNSAMHSAKANMPSLEEISDQLASEHRKEAMLRHAQYGDLRFKL